VRAGVYTGICDGGGDGTDGGSQCRTHQGDTGGKSGRDVECPDGSEELPCSGRPNRRKARCSGRSREGSSVLTAAFVADATASAIMPCAAACRGRPFRSAITPATANQSLP
jgi:hypothetical protein